MPPLIACLDVDYRPSHAAAAAVAFVGYEAPSSVEEVTVRVDEVAPYEPGAFYKRELPCLLAALAALRRAPEVVIVDGYVWLGEGAPGLGKHLFDALARATPVIGVAKTSFRGSPHAEIVLRGASQTPLYVTAEGVPARDAALHVRSMSGPNRIPTLLRRVDTLCRRARV